MANDKGWTMLAGATEPTAPANHNWRPTPQGNVLVPVVADTEVERLRLALATMAARERETAAERDALRTMLAEARERSGPYDGRLAHLTALMLRVAARRDQLASDLSVVTGQRDTALAIVEGSTAPPTDVEIAAHDGTWRCTTPRNQWDGMDPRLAAAMRDALDGEPCRWWALDAQRRPCARPTVTR